MNSDIDKLCSQIKQLFMKADEPLPKDLYDSSFYIFSNKCLNLIQLMIKNSNFPQSILLAFNELVKIMKTVWKNRPIEESQSEEKEKEEISDFIQNRKMFEDVTNRGRDLEKYLNQINVKEKDTAVFLESINNIKCQFRNNIQFVITKDDKNVQTQIIWINDYQPELFYENSVLNFYDFNDCFGVNQIERLQKQKLQLEFFKFQEEEENIHENNNSNSVDNVQEIVVIEDKNSQNLKNNNSKDKVSKQVSKKSSQISHNKNPSKANSRTKQIRSKKHSKRESKLSNFHQSNKQKNTEKFKTQNNEQITSSKVISQRIQTSKQKQNSQTSEDKKLNLTDFGKRENKLVRYYTSSYNCAQINNKMIQSDHGRVGQKNRNKLIDKEVQTQNKQEQRKQQRKQSQSKEKKKKKQSQSKQHQNENQVSLRGNQSSNQKDLHSETDIFNDYEINQSIFAINQNNRRKRTIKKHRPIRVSKNNDKKIFLQALCMSQKQQQTYKNDFSLKNNLNKKKVETQGNEKKQSTYYVQTQDWDFFKNQKQRKKNIVEKQQKQEKNKSLNKKQKIICQKKEIKEFYKEKIVKQKKFTKIQEDKFPKSFSKKQKSVSNNHLNKLQYHNQKKEENKQPKPQSLQKQSSKKFLLQLQKTNEPKKKFEKKQSISNYLSHRHFQRNKYLYPSKVRLHTDHKSDYQQFKVSEHKQNQKQKCEKQRGREITLKVEGLLKNKNTLETTFQEQQKITARQNHFHEKLKKLFSNNSRNTQHISGNYEFYSLQNNRYRNSCDMEQKQNSYFPLINGQSSKKKKKHLIKINSFNFSANQHFKNSQFEYGWGQQQKLEELIREMLEKKAITAQDLKQKQQLILSKMIELIHSLNKSARCPTNFYLRKIRFYINLFEKTHESICGKECPHLKKFYKFLNKREITMHRKQMSVSKHLMNQQTFIQNCFFIFIFTQYFMQGNQATIKCKTVSVRKRTIKSKSLGNVRNGVPIINQKQVPLHFHPYAERQGLNNFKEDFQKQGIPQFWGCIISNNLMKINNRKLQRLCLSKQRDKTHHLKSEQKQKSEMLLTKYLIRKQKRNNRQPTNLLNCKTQGSQNWQKQVKYTNLSTQLQETYKQFPLSQNFASSLTLNSHNGEKQEKSKDFKSFKMKKKQQDRKSVQQFIKINQWKSKLVSLIEDKMHQVKNRQIWIK